MQHESRCHLRPYRCHRHHRRYHWPLEAITTLRHRMVVKQSVNGDSCPFRTAVMAMEPRRVIIIIIMAIRGNGREWVHHNHISLTVDRVFMLYPPRTKTVLCGTGNIDAVSRDFKMSSQNAALLQIEVASLQGSNMAMRWLSLVELDHAKLELWAVSLFGWDNSPEIDLQNRADVQTGVYPSELCFVKSQHLFDDFVVLWQQDSTNWQNTTCTPVY